MPETTRDVREDVFLPVREDVDRYVRGTEAADLQTLKDRLGLGNYISLGGATSLFDWAKSGLSSATNYLLGKTQTQELFDTVNLTGQTLLVLHPKIQTLRGPARENAKSHWTKFAYRQQQIVAAVNKSAFKTQSLFGGGRVAREDITRLTSQGLGIALETGLLIAGTVIAAIAVIGALAALGIVITSAIKHYAEVKMYEKDINATLSTGKAVGLVAERARKADPLIGGLSEFFGVFNWKLVGTVAGVGILGLLGYVLMRKYVLAPSPAYGNPAIQRALAGKTRLRPLKTKIPKVKGPFPEALLFD